MVSKMLLEKKEDVTELSVDRQKRFANMLIAALYIITQSY